MLAWLVLALAPPAEAQPLEGLVWRVPEAPGQADEDLRRMYEAGARAVRLEGLPGEQTLRLADTLGLRLYVDLPVAYLSAASLADTLGYAVRVLDSLQTRAGRHRSVVAFGLARYVDTSTASACAYFEELAGRVRAGRRTYYVTPFVEADQCAEAVDLVLLGLRSAAQPERLLARWRTAHGSGPVGVGGLGTWVRLGEAAGWRIPHTPEAQARYLETHLPPLLDGTLAPEVVFVYRWRDRTPTDAEDALRRYYGLHTADDRPRPALDVVAGLFTGRQTVFAYAAGSERPRPTPWSVLFGWGVVALLGTFYALSPRFRHMVPRYFTAHHFYRDAVREGREVLLGGSIAILAALGVGIGLLSVGAVETLQHAAGFGPLVQWLSPSVREGVVTLVERPWLHVLLVGGVYAMALVLWAVLFVAVARRRYPLAPGQALMLIVWPRWPLFLALVGAMVVPSLPPEKASLALLVLAGLVLLVTLVAVVRTLVDFYAVVRPPLVLVLLLGLFNPLVLGSLLGLFVYLQYEPEATYLWHLLTRAG